MGCVVNGPGEAREADIGIAGGDGVGVLFKKGRVVKKRAEERLVAALLDEVASVPKSPGARRETIQREKISPPVNFFTQPPASSWLTSKPTERTRNRRWENSRSKCDFADPPRGLSRVVPAGDQGI
jgi:hypothetical protein